MSITYRKNIKARDIKAQQTFFSNGETYRTLYDAEILNNGKSEKVKMTYFDTNNPDLIYNDVVAPEAEIEVDHIVENMGT